MSKTYVGDIGTEIILDVQADITTATSVGILAKKPDGTSVTWSGQVYSGTNVHYLTQTNDLNQAGVWLLQAVIASPSWSGHSESVELVVYPLV
jgi:hypothetical protein